MNTRLWGVAVALVVAGRGLVAAAPAKVDANAETVLRAVAQHYRQLDGLQVAVERSVKTPDGGETAAGQLTFVRPGQLRWVAQRDGEPEEWYLSGTNLVLYSPLPNVFQRRPAPPSPKPVLDWLAPGLAELLGPDPRALLLEGVTVATLAGEEAEAGVACQRLKFEQEEATVEAWFEKGAQPWLRRLVARLGDTNGPVIEVRFAQWRANPVVPDQMFWYVPGGVDPRAAAPARDARGQPIVEPIQVPAKVVLEEGYKKLYLAWAERVWVAPFRERAKGQPWAGAAVKFVEAALPVWFDPPAGERPEALTVTGEKLMKDGCDDPLVTFLAIWAKYQNAGNWRDVFESSKKAVKKVEAEKQVSRTLARLIAIQCADILRRGRHKTDEQDRLAVTWTREGLSEPGAYTPAEELIAVRQLGAWPIDREKFLDTAVEWAEMPVFTEWGRRMLRGSVAVEKAWQARGGGWANKVTEKGWKGFREQLTLARTELCQAWKLRPDLPDAPTTMIRVVMAGHGAPGETERLWFDRAITAQFDYYPAYTAVLWAYRPRWGGSHELMLEFGRACLATKRFETNVPLRFTEACNDICSETKDWRAFYRQPEVARALMELSHALVHEPTRAAETRMRQSYLAVNAWLTEDYALAARTLAALDGKLHRAAVTKLWEYDVTEARFDSAVALLASPARANWDKAGQLWLRGDLDGARVAYTAALRQAPTNATAKVQAALAVLEFEEKFATGEWVKLSPDPTLEQWLVESGSWATETNGVLVNKGTDSEAMVLFRGRVGPEFEVRCEFEIEAPKNCCRRFGVLSGWHRGSPFTAWINCQLDQQGTSGHKAWVMSRGCEEEGKPAGGVKLEKQNHFLVRSHDGKISFELNGKPLITDRKLEEGSTGPKDGLLGFGTTLSCINNTVRIRNIEVRKLRSGPAGP